MEDRINVSELQLLQDRFAEVNTDGDEGIDQEEFVTNFGEFLGGQLSEKQLKHLFMKIDADSNGTIDWDEFTNFMFLEKAENEDVGKSNDAEWRLMKQDFLDPNEPSMRHKDFVQQIRYVPHLDKYMTTGRDGMLKLWSPYDFAHHRTIKLKGHAWITDSTYMAAERKIVLASTDRSIRFYDVNNRNTFDLVGQLSVTGNMGVPMCLACDMVGDKEMLFVGDTFGNVRVVGNEADYYHTRDVGVHDCPSLHQKHSDWVNKVMYISDIQALVSCSNDSTSVVYDLNHEKVKHTVDLHKQTVYSFEWCKYYSMVASCGQERDVMLWHGNSGRKIGVLSGHTQSIMDVKSAEDQYQIISVDMNKVIKVWDLRNHKCIQSFVDDEHYRPENRIMSVLYDPGRRGRAPRLVTACQHLKAWPHVCVTTQHTGHQAPLCSALYNNAFDLVVSADESSAVAVWDATTGRRQTKFKEAHGASKITAMAFDASERRLLTAANNGTVRMWNFNNGQLLKQFLHEEEELEITSVGYVAESSRGKNSLVIATSWNRRVLIWEDGGEGDVTAYRALKGHDEDILCMAYSAPNLLATGDYEGLIIVWNVTTGMRRLSLNHMDANEFERSVEKLCFLPRRPLLPGPNPPPTLLSCGGDGFVRVFSLELKGRLRHKVRGAVGANEALSAITTDETNSYLFVGDTAGHVRWWDIGQMGKEEPKGVLWPLENSFVELAVFRPHEQAISSLDYIPEKQLLVVASADTEISLWSTVRDGVVCLRHVGLFGQPQSWELGDPKGWVDPTGDGLPPPAKTPEPYLRVDEPLVEGESSYSGSEASRRERGRRAMSGPGDGGLRAEPSTVGDQPSERIAGLARQTIQHRRRVGTDVRPQTVHSAIELHPLIEVPNSFKALKEDLHIWASLDDSHIHQGGEGHGHGHGAGGHGHTHGLQARAATAPHGARRGKRTVRIQG